MFTNNSKELERKIQVLEEQKRLREDQDLHARQEQLVYDFCTAAKGLSGELKALQNVLVELKDSIQVAVDSVKGLSAMQDGLTAMVKQGADQLDQFTKAVEVLERSMSPTETNYSDYAEETPEGKERQQKAEVREMMRHGLSPDQARARMRERDIYDAMVKNR